MKRTFWLFPLSLFVVDAALAKVTYLHVNPSGSVVAATDEQGNEIWAKKYTPFGEEDTVGPVDTKGVNFSFATHERDEETSLLYMKARYYDPLIGRFYSRDPLGFQPDMPISINLYNYGANNPIMFVDPNGEEVAYSGISFSFLGMGFSTGSYVSYPGVFNDPFDSGYYFKHTLNRPSWTNILLPGDDPAGSSENLSFSTGFTFDIGMEYSLDHFNGRGVDACAYDGVGGCVSVNMRNHDLDPKDYLSGWSMSIGPKFGADLTLSSTTTFSAFDAFDSLGGSNYNAQGTGVIDSWHLDSMYSGPSYEQHQIFPDY